MLHTGCGSRCITAQQLHSALAAAAAAAGEERRFSTQHFRSERVLSGHWYLHFLLLSRFFSTSCRFVMLSRIVLQLLIHSSGQHTLCNSHRLQPHLS